jgi:asparagine synthase (glutamine-hydrolysing)
MCRIAGFWDLTYRGSYDLERVAVSMRDTLTHGGPDDAGVYLEPENGLALTHRRLSIIDLSPLGHQPMEFDNLVIVYNGEVYNFAEIRRKLEAEGHTFSSNSDTEVVLKAFHRWGTDAVHMFRGMFAFAIYDRLNKKIILCRDRAGIKPLYYYFDGETFVFASQIKAIRKFKKSPINKLALSYFFEHGYIPREKAIFENVKKLLPGHYLTFNLESKKISIKRYWNIAEYFNINYLSLIHI